MHELSIARHLLSLIDRYTPAGGTVRRVRVEAGPLCAIDPDALQWAWQASIPDTDYQSATLDLQLLPWRWRCPACGHEWESQDYLTRCRCGCEQAVLSGGDELVIVSLDIDEAVSATCDSAATPCAANRRETSP